MDIPTWAKYVIPSLKVNPSLFSFIYSPSFFQPKIYSVFTFISFCRTWAVEIVNTLVFFQLRLVTYLLCFWYEITIEFAFENGIVNNFILFNSGFLGLVQNRLYLFLDSFVWFYFEEANDCVSLVVQTKRQTKVEDSIAKKYTTKNKVQK